MAEVTKEQVLEFIKNNDLDWDESYPRSDWWKFRDERDSFRKQRDELINDMAEVKRKAEAWDKLKEELLNRAELLSKEMKGELIYCKDNFNNGVHSELFKILSRMDELDGVHEFSKLLSGLGGTIND